MTRFVRMFSLVFGVTMAASLLAGCMNTVRGAGRDTERAGEKIQKW